MTTEREFADIIAGASSYELRRVLEAHPASRRRLQQMLMEFPSPDDVSTVVNQLADARAYEPLPLDTGEERKAWPRDRLDGLGIMICMTGFMQMMTLIVLAVKL